MNEYIDPVLEELYRAREEIMRNADFDIDKLLAQLQEKHAADEALHPEVIRVDFTKESMSK